MPYPGDMGDPEIAGFMDGDGCIGIYRVKKRRASSWHYVLAVIFAQSREDRAQILRDIQKRYGGCFVSIGESSAHPSWSKRYSLRLTGWGALKLLRAAYPYLRIKRPQAELAFKFMDYRAAHTGSAKKGMSFRTMRLLPEHSEFYEKCRQEMGQNNRG